MCMNCLYNYHNQYFKLSLLYCRSNSIPGPTVTVMQLNGLPDLVELLSLYCQPQPHTRWSTHIAFCPVVVTLNQQFTFIGYYWNLVKNKSASTKCALEIQSFFVLHNPCKNGNSLKSCLTHSLLWLQDNGNLGCAQPTGCYYFTPTMGHHIDGATNWTLTQPLTRASKNDMMISVPLVLLFWAYSFTSYRSTAQREEPLHLCGECSSRLDVNVGKLWLLMRTAGKQIGSPRRTVNSFYY